jgi:hypothetical protein
VTWLQNVHDPKARDEAAYIVEQFAQNGIEIGGVADEHGGVAFMYCEGQLLAREQYLGPVREVLGDRAQAQIVKRVIRDIVLLEITFSGENGDRSAESDDSVPHGNDENPDGNDRPAGDNDGIPEGEQSRLLPLLDEIDAALGAGIVTLDTVLTTAQAWHPCPASEPQEVYDPRPYPPECPENAGEGVRIFVADTGVFFNTLAAGYPWLAGVSPSSDPDPRIDSDGTILPYGGHGTFVAGVIGCLARGAQIIVSNVFNIAGSQLESNFVPALNAGLEYGAEIFHLTAASPTRNNQPMIAFEAWLQDLHQHKGVACVVAAGNCDSRHPFWPAAFSGTVSVGALSSDRRSRAYFSNYGGWVDVYAPGQNLVNAFAMGPYRCHIEPHTGEVRHFSGMAQWSGTSFSTPIVTGLIAARMTRCGESAKEAAEALLAEARAQTIPGVGPVLFPCCDDAIQGCGRCGDKGRHCGCGGRGHGHGACGCNADCGCGGDCGHGAGCGCGVRRRRSP